MSTSDNIAEEHMGLTTVNAKNSRRPVSWWPEIRQCTLTIVLMLSLLIVIMHHNRAVDKEIHWLKSNYINEQYDQKMIVISNTTSNLEEKYSYLENKLDAQDFDIRSQQTQIVRLHDLLDIELNTTAGKLNDTVTIVKEEMDNQVQKVNDNVSTQSFYMIYQFAGTFALLGSLISIWHMTAHLRNFNQPIVQRKILAILWMVPIYCVSSFLSLVLPIAEGYFSLIKDIYEAYVIYTFLSFLIAVLGKGDRNAVIDLLAQQEHGDTSTRGNEYNARKRHHKLRPPIQLNPFAQKVPYPNAKVKAEAVLTQCQFFAMQFVLIRPLTSIAMLVADIIHESRWDWRYPQFYILLIVNISVCFAFTGLLRFYHVVAEYLQWCNPFSKFLCIKGVVFMTFWQGVLISFIANTVFKSEGEEEEDVDWDSTEWSLRSQNFLICFEMFFFAIAHMFVFITEEWEDGYRERHEQKHKATISDNLALRDFLQDVKLVMKRKKSIKKDRTNSRNPKTKNNSDISALDSFDHSLSLQETEDNINWSEGWSKIEKIILNGVDSDEENNHENISNTNTEIVYSDYTHQTSSELNGSRQTTLTLPLSTSTQESSMTLAPLNTSSSPEERQLEML